LVKKNCNYYRYSANDACSRQSWPLFTRLHCTHVQQIRMASIASARSACRRVKPVYTVSHIHRVLAYWHGRYISFIWWFIHQRSFHKFSGYHCRLFGCDSKYVCFIYFILFVFFSNLFTARRCFHSCCFMYLWDWWSPPWPHMSATSFLFSRQETIPMLENQSPNLSSGSRKKWKVRGRSPLFSGRTPEGTRGKSPQTSLVDICMAIDLAAVYLRKLNNVGRKLRNVNTMMIWFGGNRYKKSFSMCIPQGLLLQESLLSF
jgi:hypothetical protein